MEDKTLPRRPVPKRPDTGWQAWQATIGYIHQAYSADALLCLMAHRESGDIIWGASASWGHVIEIVDQQPSLALALYRLWVEVDTHHLTFDSLEAAARRPANYDDDEWLDDDTQIAADRLIHLVTQVFGTNWRIDITYKPVATPDVRVRASLYAHGDDQPIEGHGPMLRDACQTLYRSAATYPK
jgi:hypothetical protein